MLDQQYNPVEVVPMVLFSGVQFKDDKPQYGFYTHSVMDKGAVIPAKSPDGMFKEIKETNQEEMEEYEEDICISSDQLNSIRRRLIL